MFNRSYIFGHEGHPHYLTDERLNSLKTAVHLSKNDETLLTIIKSLSDPTKYKIYLLLQQVEEIPVSDMAKILNLSQSSISHALSDLKLLGIVEAHKCGKLICYSLKNSKKTSRLKQFLNSFRKKIIIRGGEDK